MSAGQPTIITERLRLRPFTSDDAEAVTALVSDRRIAADTLAIPHPYERAMAESWLAGHAGAFARGESATFAVVALDSGALVGCVGLGISREHQRAEIGWWIGVPYWGRGYCTEAAEAVMRWALETLGLHRIDAHHLSRNPASGRVMQKLGMQHEGKLRGHVRKWGVQEDVELYGVLKEEFVDRESRAGRAGRAAEREDPATRATFATRDQP
jgi:RimJ/RimL family protein N-acetyltransferase